MLLQLVEQGGALAKNNFLIGHHGGRRWNLILLLLLRLLFFSSLFALDGRRGMTTEEFDEVGSFKQSKLAVDLRLLPFTSLNEVLLVK